MTARERVLRAMNREVPDRVPRELPWGAFTPALMQVFKEKTGSDDPAEYFNFEVRSIGFNSPSKKLDYEKFHNKLSEKTRIDLWGTARERGSLFHYEKYHFPMENFTTVKEIEEYPFPDFTGEECFSHFYSKVKAYHDRELAVTGELACTVFEQAWYLRGMENLLSDFYINPEMAEVLLDKMTEIRIFQIKKFAEAGVDIVQLGDDVGQQTGLIMSPEKWRYWLKNRMERIIKAAKTIKPDILVFYHSDGDIRPIIPELIEIGIDILNPIQPECMDPIELKKLYGKDLSFWGTIGTQQVMPFGTTDDVKKAVKEMCENVGKGGGLLLAPTHILEPEVPWDNVLAFFEAIEKYGIY